MKTQLIILVYLKWALVLLAIAVLCLAYFFLAQEVTLSNSRPFRPDLGTRGLGVSGAFIGGTQDATSPFWNPAGLATLQRGNLIYDLSQGAVSVAYPVKSIGTFGVNFLDLNQNDRFFIEHTANPIGSFELGSNQLLFSFARKFGGFQFGASTGYSRAPYDGSFWAPNYDLGVMAALNPYLAVGMRWRDIGGVTIQHQDGTLLQTFEQQLGLGVVLTPHPLVRWHNRLEVIHPALSTGIEIGNRTVAARVGSMIDFGTDAAAQAWSLGFSIDRHGKQFHYTYLNHDDYRYQHLAAIGISFGGSMPVVESSVPPAAFKQFEDIPVSHYSAVRIAQEYDVDISLMLAIIFVESSFNPNAVSGSGAAGLMQIMPDAARENGLKVPNYRNRRKPLIDPKVDERFDPNKNLRVGLTYFKMLLEKYRGDLTLALGAYNVGPGKVRIRGPLVASGQRYAKKVISRYDYYRENTAEAVAGLKRLEKILRK